MRGRFRRPFAPGPFRFAVGDPLDEDVPDGWIGVADQPNWTGMPTSRAPALQEALQGRFVRIQAASTSPSGLIRRIVVRATGDTTCRDHDCNDWVKVYLGKSDRQALCGAGKDGSGPIEVFLAEPNWLDWARHACLSLNRNRGIAMTGAALILFAATLLFVLRPVPAGRPVTIQRDRDDATRWVRGNRAWSVTEDVAAAPNGRKTADLIRRTDAAPAVLRRTFRDFPGNAAAFSAYLRLPEDSPETGTLFLALRNDDSGELVARADLNLMQATIAPKRGLAELEVVGDGWYRVCLVAQSGITPGGTLAVYFGSGHDHVAPGKGFLICGMRLSADTNCRPEPGSGGDAAPGDAAPSKEP